MTTPSQPIREPGGLPYGANKDLREQQQAAPMAQSSQLPPPIPIHAPSQRPGQPVTAGADAGPGPGSDALAARPYGAPAGSTLIQALSSAAASDTSGLLSGLLVEAMKRGL